MPAASSADLSVVPLFDGTRSEALHAWGGEWGTGGLRGGVLQSQRLPSGRRALVIEFVGGGVAEQRYVQCFASGFGPSPEYYQTRDLTRYQRLLFRLQNGLPTAVRGAVQLKDYRDALAHRATYRFELPATPQTVPIDVPLTPTAPGWAVQGDPDWSRIFTIDFLFEPERAVGAGKILLSDLDLVEPGGAVDVDASPLPTLVERLARRQWDALWAARHREHSLIPNNSYQVTDAGLNTTAAVLWMLPAATRRNWVEGAQAHQYVASLLRTLGRLLDRAKYVPPRNVDWVTLKPSLLPEESLVDAAFLALALHHYKSLPATPAPLRAAIDQTQNRFNFAAFACPVGWRMAYRYAAPGRPDEFTPCTYDGYTNESNLTSLAAHLAAAHHVPVEKHWNSGAYRARVGLGGQGPAPMVHSFSEFRAPFAQALWNLFVDVRQRGTDRYPDGRLAVNPWENFVCYEQNVMRRLRGAGRGCLVQPDAGDDGTLTCYRQFSVYNDFGQGDLFMPWSAALALLAGADQAAESLRFQLRRQLHGPLGLADSAKWATGAAEPYAVTARHDFWNTGLSTMAMLEWLDGPNRLSRSFAALPEVAAALDRVFSRLPDDSARAAVN